MFVSTYNNNGLKDTLMILFKKSESDMQKISRNEDLVEIRDKETEEVVGYNLFNASTYLKNLENGPVTLSEEQIKRLNDMIQSAGYTKSLELTNEPDFVVGYVKECEPLEGSDHLNVTKTMIDENTELQIVCGAGNIAEGQKVVVAKVGAVMPNGLIIWPGELKGVKSEGMICSARELGLPQENDGIMVLEDEEKIGTAFNA